MQRLRDLPNIGKVLEQHLIAAGIDTPEQLRQLGAKEAFLRVRHNDPGACIRELLGFAGAIAGVNDRNLPEEEQRDLRAFFQSLQTEE